MVREMCFFVIQIKQANALCIPSHLLSSFIDEGVTTFHLTVLPSCVTGTNEVHVRHWLLFHSVDGNVQLHVSVQTMTNAIC